MKTEIFETYQAFLARPNKAINGVSPDYAGANPDYENQNSSNVACWNCIDCIDCENCKYCRASTDCVGCIRCSECSDCKSSKDLLRCEGCIKCNNCSRCIYCENCQECTKCVSCKNSRDSLECNSCKSVINCTSCTSCTNCVGCRSCDKCHNCCYSDCCFQCDSCNHSINLSSKSDYYNNDRMPVSVPIIENIHQRVWAAVQVEGALNMNSWHKDGFCGTTHCRAGHVTVLAGEEGRALECQTSTAFAAMQIYKASSNIPVLLNQIYANKKEALKDMERCAKLEQESNF